MRELRHTTRLLVREDSRTLGQTDEFVTAYKHARGDWSAKEDAAAWCAGLWVRLFNAKKDAAEGGGPQLDRLSDEIDERLHRAGLDT